MKELVRKELIVNRKYLYMLLLLPTYSLMMLFVEGVDKRNIGFILAIAFVSYMAISNAIEAEGKKSTHILYLSLPIYKEDIVKSRYLVYGLFPFFCTLALYIFTQILNFNAPSDDISIGLEIIIIAISISIMIQAIAIPLYYWKNKTSIVVLLVVAGIFLLGQFRVTDYERDLILAIDYGVISIILAISAIAFYSISLKISTKILKKRWLEG